MRCSHAAHEVLSHDGRAASWDVPRSGQASSEGGGRDNSLLDVVIAIAPKSSGAAQNCTDGTSDVPENTKNQRCLAWDREPNRSVCSTDTHHDGKGRNPTSGFAAYPNVNNPPSSFIER